MTSLPVKMPRLKVALLADDFNPEWPSLPIVAYKYARALTEVVDVTVFTHVRNAPNLAKVTDLPFPIVFVDNEYIAKPLHKFSTWLRGNAELGWTLEIAMRYFPYLEFERIALAALRASTHPFDVVHRITPMTPTLPSYAAGRVKAPFVIGPLNGNLRWPKEFYSERKREREWMSMFRAAYRFLPFARSSLQRSSAILAAFAHTRQGIDPRLDPKIFDMPEIGLDDEIFYPAPKNFEGQLTFLYAGRLVPYKLPEVAILAFAASPELQRHKLVIVGAGPDKERLTGLVGELGLNHCIDFRGPMTQAEVAGEMRRAHVFFFPSIRELGAGVIGEAMACGLPCLVADYGAPGELVTEQRGRKVGIASRSEMIDRFVDAAISMVQDRVALAEMSVAASDFAINSITWHQKALKTLDIYDWVVGRRLDKPILGY